MCISIQSLEAELANYRAQCGTQAQCSILEQLWMDYFHTNPVDDGRIQIAEQLRTPLFDKLSFSQSEILSELLAELITAYQRAAFLKGIQIGFQLVEELSGNQKCTP